MDDRIVISAVVILYNPPEDVIGNIMSYYDFVEKVFVFDNSQHPMAQMFNDYTKIEYYHDGNNEGIAKRLNTASHLVSKTDTNWLLTMDQDTCFSNEQIKSYVNCIIEFQQKENVGLFGTSYNNNFNTSNRSCSYIHAENLITSGMMVNVSAAKIIGPFDENLFVDSVDHDYVIRCLAAGFKVIQFTNIHILHNLGEEVYRASIKTFFLVKKKKIIHSPLRSYYMYRNMLYLENKFKHQHFYLAKGLRKIVTGNLMANIFYGRNVLSTIKYLLKAKSDFKNNRMGKITTDV